MPDELVRIGFSKGSYSMTGQTRRLIVGWHKVPRLRDRRCRATLGARPHADQGSVGKKGSIILRRFDSPTGHTFAATEGGEENGQMMRDAGGASGGRPGAVEGAIAPYRESHSQSPDRIHERLRALPEALPLVEGEGFQKAVFGLDLQHIPHEAGFARSGNSGHNRQAAFRNSYIDFLQVVVSRPPDLDPRIGKPVSFTLQRLCSGTDCAFPPERQCGSRITPLQQSLIAPGV